MGNRKSWWFYFLKGDVEDGATEEGHRSKAHDGDEVPQLVPAVESDEQQSLLSSIMKLEAGK